jgi:radical SAM superfamily enzyme YgiQ (UPF0313 family)
MKILLLNPPGNKSYVRSYYCGSSAKSGYLFQPLDLLVLSGFLSVWHEVVVLDCIAERIEPGRALNRIKEINPDLIVALVSIVSWKQDECFLSKIKDIIPRVKLIANGDVFFSDAENLMQDRKFIDGVIFDFANSDINHFLAAEFDKIENMLYRKDGGLVWGKNSASQENIFYMPVPRHELFLSRRYRFPFALHYPFTTVITSFGCPFRCSFCIANKLGFKYRPAENVIEELEYIAKLKIREIFFEDMTFGLPRVNVEKICNEIKRRNLKLSWTCFSRADVVDYGLLGLMKEAGCHTVIFGVESGNDMILKKHNKDIDKNKIIDTFKNCRKLNIKTVSTFILGLPEETNQTLEDTASFAKMLKCDYASFNMAVPRPGTELQHAAISEGLISPEQIDWDHSGQKMVMPSKYLSREELFLFKRRLEREFYFRPAYLINCILRIGSFTQLKEHLREGWQLFLNNLDFKK